MRSEDTFFSRVVETKEEASLIQCISNSAETNGFNDRELNLYSKTTTKKYLKVLIFFFTSTSLPSGRESVSIENRTSIFRITKTLKVSKLISTPEYSMTKTLRAPTESVETSHAETLGYVLKDVLSAREIMVQDM